MIILCCSETAFIIIMENLSPNHYQTPMMNFDQVKKVLFEIRKMQKMYWTSIKKREEWGILSLLFIEENYYYYC